MALELSLPDRPTGQLPAVETHPGKVEKWLASLPLLNVAEGGRQLLSTLQTYNRMEIDPERRLQLLEPYRAPVKHIVLELQKLYVGLSLPLSDRSKIASENDREFHLELAYGYKHVVLAWHAPGGRPPRIAEEAALPLQRAIYHLTEALLASFLSYSPAPTDLWREIHRLYTEAERLGIADVGVNDPLNGVNGKSTVARAYKHSLLLDLGDPYHLPPRMIVKVHQYLEGYADLATLHRQVGRVEPNCHFLVDLDSDRAAIVYSGDMALDPPSRYCLLNTVELARRIHLQLKHLQEGRAVPCSYLTTEFYRNGGQDMLLRLINVWGINPKRTFRRSSRANARLEVLIGLDAICYWLNGARRFVTSSELVGPFQPMPNTNAFLKAQDDAERPSDYDYITWEIKDDSAGGMSLRRNGTLRRRVKVGDLVAGRLGSGRTWSISAVRWVKSTHSSSIEIGIQRLAPAATPVVIKVHNDEGQESDFFPALLLPSMATIKEPPSLLTPCNVFRPARVVHMDDGTRLHRLIAGDLIESTAGFERFAFQTGPR